MKGAGRIQALWTEFYMNQVASKITNRIGSTIFSAYHNYESDANGPYSVMVGCKVPAGTAAPEGLEVLNIQAQNYMQFTTREGEMPGVVIEVWQKVWQLESQSEIKRKYSVDLEVYGENAQNPAKAQVEVFIAV